MGALGWLLAVVAILAIASRWVRSSWSPLIGLTAGFPPTCLLAILGLVFFLVVRQWWGVLTAAVVIALQALAIAPMYLPDSAAEGTTVTVLQANLRVGAGDAGAVVAAIREHDVGVVTINELTPEARAKLVAAGIDSALPYSYTIAEPMALGTGIWSRYPLTPVHQDDQGFAMRQIWAEAEIPGAGPIMLVAAHTRPPEKDMSSPGWLTELDTMGRQLHALRADVKVIVGGDFNATYDHFAFRQILTGGFADAVDQAGGGWLPTWREGHWYTRLIGIDHVLTRGATATSVSTEEIYGTDHRALIATVVVPNSSS
ncbi:endonuclease/exonuclease/phosphatase family protein [Mycobacteroides abscessus]|uniref:endonuclease/exonuclease/phosphatase family protein n=1 Tax=Mycobacteroides abscessus TaxID=36809 RepID=UPI0013901FF8|nr:endonuclease/exonuclease/phosphatase family protein [Mycobacteroides abscessus]